MIKARDPVAKSKKAKARKYDDSPRAVAMRFRPYEVAVTAERNKTVTPTVTPKAVPGKICPTCGKLFVVAKSDAERQRAYRERKKGKA